MGIYNSQAHDRKQEKNKKPYRMPTGILHVMSPPGMFIVAICNIDAIRIIREPYVTY
jgi:hypothetical protein